MAELIIKIGTNGPNPAYQDGDIVDAFNSRRIKFGHAWDICKPHDKGFNSDGLRDSILLEAFESKTNEYKYERISKTEVRRTNLKTLNVVVIGKTPDSNGHFIHVEAFLVRRLRNNRHRIFGSSGSERWYGGESINMSNTVVGEIWDAIEINTPHRRQDFEKLSLSPNMKKAFLVLSVDDFDDAVADQLVEPVSEKYIDPQGVELERIKVKRKRYVNYPIIPLIASSIEDIRNRAIEVDVRHTTLLRSAIVSIK